MVVRPVLFLWLVLCSLPGVAATLDIVPEARQVEMGKYLDVLIVHEGESPVGGADLRQWADDFFIDRRDIESESLVNGSVRTTQHVRLYPRASGEKTLQRIALGGAVAGPLRINVVPAVRDGIDATPHWLAVPTQVWQGQTFEIGVELALLHPSNQIAVEQVDLPGFDVQPLPREHVSAAKGDSVRLHWRLTATKAGHLVLDLPAIEQRGRGRWRFYLKRAAIVVRPLPDYLPPSVPVGRVALRTAVQRQDGRTFWEVGVSNLGRLPESVYGMRSALADAAHRSAEEVGVGAVEYDPLTGRSSQRYRIAVPAWSLGWGRGPSIGLRYFDVDSGQLVTLQRSLPAVWRLPAPALYVLAGLGILLLVPIGISLRRLGVRLLARLRLRAALRDAGDVDALRRLLLAAAHCATLSEWAAAWGGRSARELAEQLNAACFAGGDATSFEDLKRRALEVVTLRA